MNDRSLIYDVEAEFKGYVIYISDMSDDILEYIKLNFDCEIFKRNYPINFNMYQYKIYFEKDYNHEHEILIIYLRDNCYRYAKSF
jgi:hypothetical protein